MKVKLKYKGLIITMGLISFQLFHIETDSLRAQVNPICYNPNLVIDTSKKSINSIATGMINGDSVIIKYHSPGVRNRVIWGGLVPYDEVWVTGAHDATTIEFMKPLWINDKEIPEGKYAIFTIPGRKEWTVIFNKHWQQHLASEYNSKDDVLRLNVRPMKNKPTERLQYFIEDKGEGKGSIVLAWEKLKISFDIISGELKK